MNYLQGLRARDKREGKLSSLEHQVKLHEEQKVRMKVEFEKQLQDYKAWKTEHKIQGLLY